MFKFFFWYTGIYICIFNSNSLIRHDWESSNLWVSGARVNEEINIDKIMFLLLLRMCTFVNETTYW